MNTLKQTTTENIPRRVKAFARLWALKFIALNPKWQDGDAWIDEWHAFGGFDINIYCEEGYLSVCVYGLFEDEFGNMNTDHCDFICIVKKGNY
jgi:hypothetical protein